MQTRILVGMMAVGFMLLSGCCEFLGIGCDGGGGDKPGFYITLHNGLTPCADQNGEFDLEFKWEWTDTDLQTSKDEDFAELNQTAKDSVYNVADANSDDKADHVKVSVNRSCTPQYPLWQDFTFDNQIPAGGTVAFNVDDFDNVTYTISGPQGSVSKATSAVKQVFGIKSSPKKSCCR